MQPTQLRSVRPADAQFLWRVANDPLLLELLAELPTVLEEWQSFIGQWSQDEDEADYIIVRSGDGAPVGWLGVNGLADEDQVAWLKCIALLPEYWGKGYASSAIDQVKAELALRQVRRLRLWTDQANMRAQRCYARLGFGTIEQALRPTGSRREMRMRLLMECSLAP